MKSLFLVFFTIMFIGCSQQSAQTKAKISLGAATANYPGELYVLGKKSTGEMFSYKLSTEEKDVFLPNGSWTFMALGWTGSAPFTGELKCAKENYNLSGSDVEISLSLSVANCADGLFGAPEFKDQINGFKAFEFHACNGIKQKFLEDPAEMQNAYAAKSFGDCADHPGLAKSFRVALFDFDPNVNPNSVKKNEQLSECSSNISNIDFPYTPSAVRLPNFDVNFYKFPVKVLAYPDNNCAGSPEEKFFVNGLAQPHPQFEVFSIVEEGIRKLFFDVDNCRAPFNSNTPFANGYTATGVNIICSPAQLFAIDNNSGAYMGDNFALGKNIDLDGFFENDGNDDQQIYHNDATPFSGSLEGNGYKISNYTSTVPNSGKGGLFRRVSDVEIENVILEEFTVSAGGTLLSSGALIGEMVSDGLKETRIDVTLKGSNILAANSPCIGGVIGFISANGNSADDFIYINAKVEGIYNNNVLVSGTGNYISGKNKVGSIIGCAVVDIVGNNDMFIVESSTIKDTFLTAASEVGGIIGSTNYLEAKKNSINIDFMINPLSTFDASYGGIAGVSTKFRSYDNWLNVSFFVDNDASPNNVNITSLGGVVGSSEYAIINGDYVAEMLVTQNGAEEINWLGGIAGFLNTGTGHSITNTSVNMTSVSNGGSQGGIVGFITGPGNIEGNIARGLIGQTDPNDGVNMARGGIVGNANGGVIAKNISYMDVYANSIVGGVVGENAQAMILNVYAKGTVTTTGGQQAGGLVGHIANNALAELRHSIFDGDLVSTGSCTYCNYLVGWNQNSSCQADISGLIATTDATATVNGSSVSKVIANMIGDSGSTCVSGNAWTLGAAKDIFITTPTCSASTDSSTNNLYCMHANYLNSFMGDSGDSFKAKLIFVLDLLAVSPVVGGEIQNVGSGPSPILIDSVAKWNSIAGKNSLMSKTFKLTADLDFNNGSFTPFGGDITNIPGVAPEATPFNGNLIANGKKLKKITMTVTTNSKDIGVIRRLGNNGSQFPNIGSSDDPLVIEDLTIDLSTDDVTNAGAIGRIQGGIASVQVKNGLITGVGAGVNSSVGGIAGELNGGHIINSFFQGEIDVSGYGSVGGLAGYVTGSNVRIMNSYSQLTNLIAAVEVGGIVGYFGATSPQVTNVYTRISGQIGEASATDLGGLIGQNSSTGEMFENMFADFYGNTTLFVGSDCTVDCYLTFSTVTGTATNIVAVRSSGVFESDYNDTGISDETFYEPIAQNLITNVYQPESAYSFWDGLNDWQNNWMIQNDNSGVPRLILNPEEIRNNY
jgi:hypothetical protein